MAKPSLWTRCWLGAVTCIVIGSGSAVARTGSDEDSFSPEELRLIYDHAWSLPARGDPSNAVADTPEAIALGKMLFFETGFSVNGKVACATCHQPDKGFTDGRALARTLAQGNRNTPTVLNAVHQKWYFWDGRADSLWSQALQVIENPKEFGGNRMQVAHHVYRSAPLRQAYEQVFGAIPALDDPARFPLQARPGPDDGPQTEQGKAWQRMSAEDRDVVNRIFSNIGKALAAYERQLVSRSAPFDAYVEGLRTGDPKKLSALSASQKRGLRLFVGQARCNLCHSGPNFSDDDFHNLGLPGSPRHGADAGRAAGIPQVKANLFNGTGPYSDKPDQAARDRLEYLPAPSTETGKFKTPTLRSVALTAPYMHDGRLGTLHEVLRFYRQVGASKGGSAVGEREATLELIPPLTRRQVEDLVAFLKSLTGEPLPSMLTAAPTATP